MYLKRLELHGFKSFASPTRFEFGPGVTCVVGPNGSGKTNVAEAIRWVLGEHASRTLRARKTEDVIFSGSTTRSPLGMAEVRLTLDNSDGWLPLDFEEVVVSRRAYRNGENEYYINQSRVRLKDVTELFLKAQVGQNSYAFMGQGLVEEVLTLRPEDRRGLIEEAADVRLHRTRLEEARNRLNATRENLDRIAMLVSELEPRLRQLERQADRASAHARLSEDLAQALQAWFGQQWREAQEALAASRAACDQRQEECDSARRHVDASEQGLAALATALDERRRDITTRDETSRRLDDYRRDLERRVTIDDERRAMLTARHEELTAAIEALRAEREELATNVAAQEERVSKLEAELAAVRGPGPQQTEELHTRLQELRDAVQRIEGAALEAGTRLGETEAKLAALTERQASLTPELEALERRRHEQLASLKSWAQEFAARRRRSNEIVIATQQAVRRQRETERHLRTIEGAVAARQDELRQLTFEIETGEARFEAAQSTNVELPPPDAGVRQLLVHGGRVPDEQPPDDARIHGMIGMLGQLLRVPNGLERAIEAALGDAIHAVVVDRQEDALAAVELLISEDAGRATVFPLSDVRSDHPLNLLDERGVVGVAAELVRCDHRYRPLVTALLGRTIVAENLGTAKRLLRRGLGSVVTLDGILLRPSGAMTAGSARAIRRALAHQRDVDELPEELKRLRVTQKEAAAALEAGQRDLETTRKVHEPLVAELERLEAERGDAERALRQHRQRLSAPAARLSALHARRQDNRRALLEAEHTLAGATEERDLAASQRDARHQELTRLRADADALATQLETISRSGAELAHQVAALEAEQGAAQHLRETQAGTLARVERDLTQRQEGITGIGEELHTVSGRLEATRRELDEQSREAAALHEELSPARHELEQLESRQRAINGELAAARTRALESERALLDTEASVHLRSEELDILRQRLQEEGLTTSPEGEIVPLEQPEGPPDWLAVEVHPEQGRRARSEPGRSEEHASEELPPMRGGQDLDTTALRDRVSELRAKIRSLGPVNEEAAHDYQENRERHDYLSAQLTDLQQAEASLMGAIEELEGIIRVRFSHTFQEVNREFQRYFQNFFGGGQAELQLTRTEEDTLPGVEIIAQPPRKRVRTINMLSGGERSLTAVALLFALLHIHPSPICVLDEVDAALDEANVDRFAQTLLELKERTEFIIITHNRRTIEMADTIYGVSMGEDSTSALLSLRLSDLPVN